MAERKVVLLPNGKLDAANEFIHDEKHGGGSGGGDDMLQRVKALEEKVAAMATDIAIIKSNYATKEDIASVRIEVHQSISNQTKWLAATMIGIAGMAMAVAKLIF